MSYLIEIQNKKNFIYSHFRGPVTNQGLAELVVSTAKKAEEFGLNSYFVDFRDAGNREVALVDDYNFAYGKHMGPQLKRGARYALLIRNDGDITQWEFVETVFQNAGFVLKLFTEESEAFSWIGKEQSLPNRYETNRNSTAKADIEICFN